MSMNSPAPLTPPSVETPVYGNELNDNEDDKWYKRPIIMFLIGFIIGLIVVVAIFYNVPKNKNLDTSNSSNYAAEMERLESENNSLKLQLNKYETDSQAGEIDTVQKDNEISKLKDTIELNNVTISNLEAQVEDLNEQITTLKESNKDSLKLGTQLETANNSITDLKAQVETLQKENTELKGKITELEKLLQTTTNPGDNNEG